MKSKVFRQLRLLRRTLSSESWMTYRKFIGNLCLDHAHRPWSAVVSEFLRNDDILGLVNFADSLVAQKHATADEHFSANQIAALIRKYPFPENLNPFDPEKQARITFFESELNCSYFNGRFSSPKFWVAAGKGTEVEAMHRFISYVLGPYPPLRLIYGKCYFGPGASVGVHGNATNVARKIASQWSVSPKAYMYARSAALHHYQIVELLGRRGGSGVACLDPEEIYNSFLKRVSICTYNKIAFVPKTTKTERSIAVEPLLNGYLQGGVDIYMRDCLRRVGIDLSLGQSINSDLAFIGSIRDDDDSFVTIDLKSASDSISIGLCRAVLPSAWFEFLDSIRSTSYALDDHITRSEKFCSMGNGFCFPLESLLFTAACSAIGCGTAGVDFHVYGDDIIVRKRYAEPLLDLLYELGFTVNTTKTFLEGPFRESCGTDWYCGDDVRPFTLDFPLDSFESVAKVLNLSRRNARTSAFFEGTRPLLLDLIPDDLRIFRPLEGPADTAITVEGDLFMTSPFAEWSKDLQCWGWLELVFSPVPDKWVGLRDSDISLVMVALRGKASSSKPFTVRRKTRTGVRKVAYA